jgi:peptidoglycan/LPS O-acetylase OafA/YrhL
MIDALPRPIERSPAPVTRSDQRFYLPQLDGVRFLAFFLVFLHHLGPGDVFRAWSRPFSTFLKQLHLVGWIGVDVFLTLSGFLIALLLLRELDTTGSIRIRQFYARRILRLWPLYYLVLVLGFFVMPMALNMAWTPAHTTLLAEQLFPYATLFSNVSSAMLPGSFGPMSPAGDSLGPLWTIALEEQFYLVFPLIVLAAGPVIKLRAVLGCALVVIAFTTATRYYLVANSLPYPIVWLSTATHLDPIVLGIVGAVIWHRHRENVLRLRLFGADLLLAVGVFWLVMTSPHVAKTLHHSWQILAAGLSALLLIGAVLRYRPLAAIFGWRPVAWLGRISYGLYMFHILGRQVYQFWIAPHLPLDLLQGPFRWLADFSLVLLATVVLATVSYYGYERYFLRLKERFTVVRSRPA